ncbi:Zinc binding domain / DNA primase [Klebsiella pneumoniae]|uniref:Zinc binding domain / DNA primase n=1 Tax=Klebsiella pneumoniae TaxID=573 RepID=A0A4P0YDE2_KLEPN|nr:Zinc binding domain / DNA primase [Klebsiella pneumoniae]
MSEAEFTAMSTSEKAMRVHEHYGEALAVDANGQLLSRYEAGYGKSFHRQTLPRRGRVISASARPVLVRENCSLVETLN